MGGPGRARLEEITVEGINDEFHHAPRVWSDPGRNGNHFRRPGGGLPREELHSPISMDKPEKNSTLGTSNEANVNMRLCLRFEGAFVRVARTLSTPACNC